MLNDRHSAVHIASSEESIKEGLKREVKKAVSHGGWSYTPQRHDVTPGLIQTGRNDRVPRHFLFWEHEGRQRKLELVSFQCKETF